MRKMIKVSQFLTALEKEVCPSRTSKARLLIVVLVRCSECH